MTGATMATDGAPLLDDAAPRGAGRDQGAPAEVRRIVVGFDAADPGQTALAVAAALAERLRAELCGLFIEDGNLHRLAALPFATELQLPTGVGRPLQAQALAGELRTLAEGARQAVAAAAGRAQVGWSFEVRRGPVAALALAEAGEMDLLLLPGARRLHQRVMLRRPGAGRALEGDAREARGAAVVHRARRRRRGERAPIFVIFDDGEGAERVLTVASCLAEGQERPLRVLSLAGTPGAARLLQEQAAQWLSARGLGAEGLTLPGAGPAQVGTAVRVAGGGVVVLGSDSPLLRDRAVAHRERVSAAVVHLQDELSGPLLLVR